MADCESIQVVFAEETIQAIINDEEVNVSVEAWPGTNFSPENMVFVAKNGSDANSGAWNSPFLNIQAGIDSAYSIYGPVTDFSHGPVILVAPGRYEEQIHSYLGYRIQGFTHEASPERKPTVLYNTGADPEHYPLRGDDGDKYYIEGINIEVASSGGTLGKISGSYFTKVYFRNGSFIEATEVANTYTAFKDCSFFKSGFNFTGDQTTGRHTIQMDGCWLSRYSWITSSTHNDTCGFYIDGCVFNQAYPNLGGDWGLQLRNSHVFGSTRTQIATSNRLVILNSILSNGLHFVTNPDTVKIQSCGFNDNEGYPITGEDITADTEITTIAYFHNVQQNGISGKIQILSPVKNVGCYATDSYATLQDAITSIPASEIAVVRVWKHCLGLEKLTLPNIGTQITIDGQKKYNLEFTGDIVDITGSQHFGFNDMVKVDGGTIRLNGATAEVSLESNQYVLADLVIDNGAFSIVYQTSLFGPTGKKAITINSLITPVIIGYSRIEGATGQPAIGVTVECDEKLKVKFSTLISGSPLTVAPIIYTGANKLDVFIYNTGMSGSWNAAEINNKIGNPNLTTDPEITF